MDSPQDAPTSDLSHVARTKKDTVQLTKNLDIPSREVPGTGAPVWKSASVRKGRLRAAIMSTVVFAVVAVGVAVLLAWATNPVWGNYPQAPATVVGKTETTSKGGAICTVTLRFAHDGVPHEAKVRSETPCGSLPKYKAQVTLAYNPADFSGVLIVGHDQGIRATTSMIALMSAIPLLGLLTVSVMCVRSYRNARRAATAESWQEITVVVKDVASHPEHTDLLVHARDGGGGSERNFVIGYHTPKMAGFAPQKDSEVTFRLVSDGDGHAILSTPDGSGTCDAAISTPNSFELRTLGL